MTSRVKLIGVTAALAGMALAGAATASAKTTIVGVHIGAQVSSKAPTAPVSATAKPAGYKVVSSGFISAPNGSQTFGSVACPNTSGGAARYPQGGGVLISATTLGADINGSFPSGQNWNAYVNNNTGSDTAFEVWAVCGTQKSTYSVVTNAGVVNPAGVQTGADAVCPVHTKVLGGGGVSSSFDLAANINSSYPVNNGWHIDMNNGSASSTTFAVYAVCEKLSSHATYAVVAGTQTDNPSSSQTAAAAACPAGTVPLGGGAFSSTSSTAVSMNTTEPFGNGWVAYEDNGSSGDAFIIPYAVCAS